MSHFTCLVIGDEPEKQLAPYHEFECTGRDDQYVQELDITDELRAEYLSETDGRLRDPQGRLHKRYADQFYRDPTPEERSAHMMGGTGCGGGIAWTSKDWGDGLGYRPKVHFIPDGYEEVEVPHSELRTFAEFARDWHEYPTVPHGEAPDLNGAHKYRYALLDGRGDVVKIVRRTNPNKKWDWYQLGGRWSGFFQLRPGCSRISRVGSPGLFTQPAEPGTADQALKGDIDFNTSRILASTEAGARWDRAHAIIDGRAFETWAQVREAHGEEIEAARAAYRSQGAVSDLSRAGFWQPDEFLVGRGEYCQQAAAAAGVTFAVVKDGQWYERGRMGWWAVVHDEKDAGEWQRQFWALLEGLSDYTLLSLYDCHI